MISNNATTDLVAKAQFAKTQAEEAQAALSRLRREIVATASKATTCNALLPEYLKGNHVGTYRHERNKVAKAVDDAITCVKPMSTFDALRGATYFRDLSAVLEKKANAMEPTVKHLQREAAKAVVAGGRTAKQKRGPNKNRIDKTIPSALSLSEWPELPSKK